MNVGDLHINNDFIKRMRELLSGDDFSAYAEALNRPPVRLARLNPLKPAPISLISDETGDFPLLAPSAKPGKGALHDAGAYYVQEPAAAAVAGLIAPFLPQGGKVLDMCAAPGGKITAAAAERPDCEFVANETVFSRAKILLSNVERMGLRNCTVTSLRPDSLSGYGAGLFDAVIADVPCSGEGMLRKTGFESGDLSDECVNACAARAEKILDECDKCLAGGGILLFSTCTFNIRENEDQVLRLMREYGYEPLEPERRCEKSRCGYGIKQAVRFFPQDGGGEGHFACLLKKPNSPEQSARRHKRGSAHGDKRISAVQKMLRQITNENFDAGRMLAQGEGLEYVSSDYPFYSFPALRRGIRLADFNGDRAIPHHHFATAANADLLISSPDYIPSAKEISAYLSGNEFYCDAPDGYRVLKTAGITLGLVKISGSAAKNRYPKGLRFT